MVINPLIMPRPDRAFRWAQRIVFVVTPEKISDDRADSVLSACTSLRIASPVRNEQMRRTRGAGRFFFGKLADRNWPDAEVFCGAAR